MADVALTAAQIAVVHPEEAEVYSYIAAEAITRGQAVYELAAGGVGVADATTADGKLAFVGIALRAAAANEAVPVLARGMVYGFTVSSINCGTVLYLSETAGALADAAPAGTGTAVKCGRVTSLSDPAKTRVVWINGYTV